MRKLLLSSILFLTACDDPKDAVRKLEYFRDGRTGICFASGFVAADIETRGLAFTYVPCEKVPKELLQDLK